MKLRHSHNEIDNEEPEHRLYEAIAAVRNAEEAKIFLEDLCTPNERQALVDRWRVVEPVKNGISYRTISNQTGISVTTIGRVARCLQLGKGGYNLIYDRLLKRKYHVRKSKAHLGDPKKGEIKS